MQTAIGLQQSDSNLIHKLLMPIRLIISAIEASLMFTFFFLVLLTFPIYLFITGQPVTPILSAGWQLAVCSIPLIIISPRTSTLMFCTIFGVMVGPECMLGMGAALMALVSLLTALRHTYRYLPCILSVLWWALVLAFLLTGHTLFPGHPPEFAYSSTAAAMVLGNILSAVNIRHHYRTLLERANAVKWEVDSISETMRREFVEEGIDTGGDRYQSLNQKRIGLIEEAVDRAYAAEKFGKSPIWMNEFRRTLIIARN